MDPGPGAGTPVRFGWYGDDFTGATDTLASLAEAGLRAVLFLGVPTPGQLSAAGRLDAVGIAGATRAMDPAAMRAELAPAGAFFAGLGVPVLHYKCCSTFDSAPHVGSIGAAVECLRPFFPNPFVPIVGGQPNIGRYCTFSTLFAAAGIGGAVHRLDRHPTMAAHPVTPMDEADLRRHLAAQGLRDVAAMHFPGYDSGPEAMDALLDRLLQDRPPAVLLDVSRPADLHRLGPMIWRRALQQKLLAVGPSSVAQALAAAWGDAPAPAQPRLAPAEGPVFVMVGSLSPVTRRQVEASPSYLHREVEAATLLGDPGGSAQLSDEVAAALRSGRSVMVRTAPPAGAAAASDVGATARATAGFVAGVLRAVPLRRVGIAGGDTSSQAALGLGLWGLSYQATLAPGVTLCRTHSDDARLDGLELMLKGGQMGPPGMFEQLLHGG